MKRKILSILLTFAMVFSLMPTTVLATETVEASADKSIMLGAGGISAWSAEDGYEYLYFGQDGDKDPILWRVLDTNGNATGANDRLGEVNNPVNNSKALFLMSEYAFDDTKYSDPTIFSFQGSFVNQWCEKFLSSSFSEPEQAALIATTKELEFGYVDDSNTQHEERGPMLVDDKVFILSEAEVVNATYGFVADDNLRKEARMAKNKEGKDKRWFLRTTPTDYSINIVVTSDGWCDVLAFDETAAVRPACNLNKETVAFISDASGDTDFKTSTTGLTPVSKITAAKNEQKWKITLRDNSRKFRVTEKAVTAAPGGKIELNYSGASTGTKEYVSAMIVGEKDEVLYYGPLKTVTDASGTAELTIPSDLDIGDYKLYVFSEQRNAGVLTDYASELQLVTLKVAHTHSFTYATSGDTITATCTADGCPLPGKTASIQFTASNDPYDGEAYDGASLPEKIEGVSLGTITYTYKTRDELDGAYSESVPTDVGDYTVKASFTIGTTPYVLTQNFSITKAAYTGYAAGTPGKTEVTANSVTLEAPTAITDEVFEYAISETKSAPANDNEWKADLSFGDLEAGKTYYFYSRVKGNDNHEPGGVCAEPLIVTMAPPANVVTVNYSEETITYGSDYKVKTSKESGEDISNNASISGYIGSMIYVRKEVSGSIPASEWAEVSLAQRPSAPEGVTASHTDTTITLSGTTAAMEYKIGGGNWTDCSANNTTISTTANTPYNIDVRFKAVNEGDSKAFASEKVQPPLKGTTLKTPSDGDFTFTKPDGNLIYNKQGKEAAVTAKNTVTGMGSITVEYQKSGDSNWSKNAPKDAGTYRVRINVAEGTDYAAKNEITNSSWSFTIAPKPVTLSWFVGDTDTAYTDDAFTYDKTAKTVKAKVANAEQGDTFELVYGDAANVKTNASDSYTATVSALGNDNYTLAGGEGKDLTWKISPKPISLIWKDTSKVYSGAAQNPTFDFVGLENDDDVTAQLKDYAVNAGNYIVEAELTGAHSENYVIDSKSAKGRFVIEKAPVTFTVTNNVHPKGNVPSPSHCTITADKLSGGYSTIYQDSKGNSIDPLTAPAGTYDVCVALDVDVSENYRHADVADGSIRKIGVLVITDGAALSKYNVTYDANGGTGTVTDTDELVSGDLRTLKANSFTNDGKTFGGWEYNGKLYYPGESFTQPEGNVTFKAVWVENVYGVNGKVMNDAKPSAPVSKAVVTLKKGSDTIETLTTSEDGGFNFKNAVVPGMYNLVVSKNKSTTTVLVEIDGADWNNGGEAIILPDANLNAIVEVKAGTPTVLVGNLENNFTVTDKTDATTKDVELKIVVEATIKNDLEKAAIVAKDKNVGLFLDLKLTKTVEDNAEQPITEADKLLKIVVQLPADLQGKSSYTVYRYHDGDMQTLTTSANDDGEKIEVSSDRKSLIIFTKKFSLYAIAGVTSTGGSGGGGSAETKYSVSEPKAENGAVKITSESASKNTKITIEVKPDEGYELDKLTVTDANGNEIEVTKEKEGLYNFYMPEGNVDVKATFKKTGEESSKDSPFTDVKDGDWFYDSVMTIYEKGLMSGTAEDMFSPDLATTRGMIATIVYRMEGEPEITGECPFGDVAAGSYYEKAIAWAAANGIVAGYSSDVYAPDQNISREQLAAILLRYAKFKGYDVSVGEDTNILSFDDADQITEYAIPAIQWVCGSGLVSGMGDGTLAPQGEATRAQLATILIKFLGNIA